MDSRKSQTPRELVYGGILEMAQPSFHILWRRKLRPRKVTQLIRPALQLKSSIPGLSHSSRRHAQLVIRPQPGLSICTPWRGCWFCVGAGGGGGSSDQNITRDGAPHPSTFLVTGGARLYVGLIESITL